MGGGEEGGGLVACVPGVKSFFITENWVCAITRHHADAESNINILLTRNLSIDSVVRH